MLYVSGQGRLDWTDEVDRAHHEDKADRAFVQTQQRGQFAALQLHEDGQLGVASSSQLSRLLDPSRSCSSGSSSPDQSKITPYLEVSLELARQFYNLPLC